MINKDMTVGEVLRSCSDAAMDAVVKIFTDMGDALPVLPAFDGGNARRSRDGAWQRR